MPLFHTLESFVLDPTVGAIVLGFLAAVGTGSAAVYGLRFVGPCWRRSTEWLLIAGAAALAGLAGLEASAGGSTFPYVLAVLPGLVTFLAWRSVLASALVSFAPLYFVIGILTRGAPTYTPEIALDRAVPLQPAWIIVYGSLYVFVAILPMLVVRDRELFRRAMQAYLTVMLVAYAGFLLYPTAAPRPADVPGDGFPAWSLRLAYSLDPPHGCFPSLHVAYSFVAALTCYRVHRGVGTAAVLWAGLIAVSTLYTKQHYVVDAVAGALAAYGACVVFLRAYPREAVSECDRRLAPARASAAVAIFGLTVAAFWAAYLTRG